MGAVAHHNESELTAAQLREQLSYDSETGLFRWKDTGKVNSYIGCVAGNTSHKRGYRLIRVNYVRYLAHRLAWLYVYGEWPSGEVDHINGRTDDNSVGNLRIATRQQNCWNGAAKSNNEFGMRNIRPKGRKFMVHFSRNNKRVFNKSFPSLASAITARDRVAATLYGEFAPCRE